MVLDVVDEIRDQLNQNMRIPGRTLETTRESASDCPHLAHVGTQFSYALTLADAAVLLGTLARGHLTATLIKLENPGLCAVKWMTPTSSAWPRKAQVDVPCRSCA
jgi:hypothetical protein